MGEGEGQGGSKDGHEDGHFHMLDLQKQQRMLGNTCYQFLTLIRSLLPVGCGSGLRHLSREPKLQVQDPKIPPTWVAPGSQDPTHLGRSSIPGSHLSRSGIPRPTHLGRSRILKPHPLRSRIPGPHPPGSPLIGFLHSSLLGSAHCWREIPSRDLKPRCLP